MAKGVRPFSVNQPADRWFQSCTMCVSVCAFYRVGSSSSTTAQTRSLSGDYTTFSRCSPFFPIAWLHCKCSPYRSYLIQLDDCRSSISYNAATIVTTCPYCCLPFLIGCPTACTSFSSAFSSSHVLRFLGLVLHYTTTMTLPSQLIVVSLLAAQTGVRLLLLLPPRLLLLVLSSVVTSASAVLSERSRPQLTRLCYLYAC